MRVVGSTINDDWITLKGSNMVWVEEMIEDAIGVARDIGSLMMVIVAL
jgi:hypothetical protein